MNTETNTLFSEDTLAELAAINEVELPAVNANADNEVDELAALLSEETKGDELSALAEEEVSAEIEAEIAAAVEEQALQQVEMKTAREEALQSQAEKHQAKAKAKGEKVAKPKPDAGVATKAKRSGSTASMKKSEAVVHKLGDSRYEVLILDTAMAGLDKAELEKQVDAFVEGFDNLAKKVGEKALNVACSLNNTDKLSVYTQIAIELLKEKGEMTTNDLRQKYLERPYSAGTSSAQSSQMFQLLPYFKIAHRSGNSLILNPDSVIADLV